jgi:hypothetical protein
VDENGIRTDPAKKKNKKKKQVIDWSATAKKAFKQIKNTFVSSPVLCSPDFKQPFIIQCDASGTGLGGVISYYTKYRRK